MLYRVYVSVQVDRNVWRLQPVNQIFFKTAGLGMVDRDCDLDFKVGRESIHIEFSRTEQENGKR